MRLKEILQGTEQGQLDGTLGHLDGWLSGPSAQKPVARMFLYNKPFSTLGSATLSSRLTPEPGPGAGPRVCELYNSRVPDT